MLPVRRRPRPARQVRSNIRPLLDRCEVRLTPALFNAATTDELIAAINAANTNAQSDTITLADGAVFNFTTAADPTDGGSALPSILYDNGTTLKIVGNGATFTRSTAGGPFRFFRVADSLQGPAQLILTDLTLTGGASNLDGGAIYLTGGSVELIDCVVTNNSAVNGGAIGTFNSSLDAPQIILTRTEVTGNVATSSGGALANLGNTSFVISDSTISSNTAAGSGGAIRSQGSSKLTVSNSIFENNRASNVTGNGGAVSWQGDDVDIVNTEFLANVAGSGGAISIFGTTVNANITGSSLVGNTTTFDLSNGGAVSFTGGTLSLTNTLVDSNIAKSGGGLNVSGNLTVLNSAIVNNTADGTNGGGIAITGGVLSLTNVTVDSNKAAGDGGGVFIPDTATSATFVNATVTSNAATSDGGGVFVASDGTGTSTVPVTFGNTVIAYNQASAGGDLNGGFLSDGGNLFGVVDPAFAKVANAPTDFVGTVATPIDPFLLPLADNGGGTPTRAPRLSDAGLLSLVIDRGLNALNTQAADQRNNAADFPRIDLTDNKIDIGAFEAPKGDLRIRKIGPTGDLIPGDVVVYTVIAENASTNVNQRIPNARIQDLLDTRFDASTAIWTATYVGTTGKAAGTGEINEVVDLPAEASVTYILTVQVARSAAGTLTNTATADAPGLVDANPDDNADTVVNPLRPTADVQVVKRVTSPDGGSGRVAAGVPITYEVTVTNAGPSDVRNIRFTDDVPLGATRMTWTAEIATDDPDEPVVALSGTGRINEVFNLPFGLTATFTIQLQTSFDRGGPLTNTAKVTLPSGVDDPVPENNSSTVVVELQPGGHVVTVGSGAGEVATVRVYVAQTGTILREIRPYGDFRGGLTTAAADFTGDGVLDIVTAAGPGGGPHVQVFDGTTGDLLSSFFAYTPEFFGGVFVAAGDTDGDGVPEIVTGPGAGGGPHVRVVDWRTGESLNQPLTDFFAYDPSFNGGVTVAVGDLNGDLRFDVLTGAGPGGGPHVQGFDGATGQRTASFFAYDEAFTGGVFVTVGDINFDGDADIITGPGFGGGANVRAFSPRNGQLFRDFIAFDTNLPPALLTTGVNGYVSGVRVATTAVGFNGTSLVIVGTGPGARPLARVLDTSTGDADLAYDIFDGLDPSFLGGVFVGGG